MLVGEMVGDTTIVGFWFAVSSPLRQELEMI